MLLSAKRPAQTRAQFRGLSILRNSQVVFNLAGNKYRVVVHVRYDIGFMFIQFIRTHARDDRIDAETV